MSGRLIAIVGPSGVGKDSVMQGTAARDPRIMLARRVITRPADVGGEDFEGVTVAQFQARQAAGEFALSWSAHGLSYGIPASVDAQLDRGRDVLVNLSRSVLVPAKERFARFLAINLTAPPEILAARLAARGREDASQIERRLDRAQAALPQGIAVQQIDNSGALDQTVEVVLAQLYPVTVP